MSGIQTPELWCVDLGAAGPALHTLEERTPRLSPADRVRASDLTDPIVRAEWLATHIALRLLIERAAGTQWRRAVFTRSERGKPHLDGTPLAFSISHAPGLALIGLAPRGSIGVDIERTRRVRVGEARRARIEEAGAALSNEPLPTEGNARFLQAWVRLESLAKADGCGIGRLLTRLGILGVSDEVRAGQASARRYGRGAARWRARHRPYAICNSATASTQPWPRSASRRSARRPGCRRAWKAWKS